MYYRKPMRSSHLELLRLGFHKLYALMAASNYAARQEQADFLPVSCCGRS